MTPDGRLRRHSAICKASQTSLAVNPLRHSPAHHSACIQIEHHRQVKPTLICRDIGLMSLTHFWFGAMAVKSCSSRLGATGRLWLELVVALYFARRLWRAGHRTASTVPPVSCPGLTFGAQLSRDPGCAGSAFVCGEYSLDVFHQASVGFRPPPKGVGCASRSSRLRETSRSRHISTTPFALARVPRNCVPPFAGCGVTTRRFFKEENLLLPSGPPPACRASPPGVILVFCVLLNFQPQPASCP